MIISRYGIVERPDNLPHISGAVVHGDTVYLRGVTAEPGGDITFRTPPTTVSMSHLPTSRPSRSHSDECRL
jgi:hypothetical protein